MKLLYCELCGDILAPRQTRLPRFCTCGTHAVWWEDPNAGVLRIYEQNATYRQSASTHAWARKETPHKAWVLGLHNSFLLYNGQHTKDTIRQLITETPDSYLFKTQESMIIRVRPGESGDTDWAESLPGENSAT